MYTWDTPGGNYIYMNGFILQKLDRRVSYYNTTDIMLMTHFMIFKKCIVSGYKCPYKAFNGKSFCQVYMYLLIDW